MPGEILIRLSKYWQEKPASLIFARFGEELFKSGQRNKAIEILRAGIEKYPGYITGYIVLAKCFLENNQIDEAEITAKVANQVDPYNPVVLDLLAEIAFRKRDLELGLSYLNEILAIDPSNIELQDKISKWQGEFRETLQPTPPPEALIEEEKHIEKEAEKAHEQAVEEIVALTEEVYKLEKAEEKPPSLEPVEMVSTKKDEMPEPEVEEIKLEGAIEKEKEPQIPEITPIKPLDEDIIMVDKLLSELEEKEKISTPLPPEEDKEVFQPPFETGTTDETVLLSEESILGEDTEITVEQLEGLELSEEFTLSDEKAKLKEKFDKEGLISDDQLETDSIASDDSFIYRPEGEGIDLESVAEEAIEKIEEIEKFIISQDEEIVQKPKIPITATMAEVYASQGNFKKASEIYQQLITLTNNPDEKKLYEKRLAELRELISHEGL